MQDMGNTKARLLYEANLPENFRRPQTDQYPLKISLFWVLKDLAHIYSRIFNCLCLRCKFYHSVH